MDLITVVYSAALIFSTISIAVALVIIVGLLLAWPTTSQRKEDPLGTIRFTGLEARHEMDRVCSDYVSRQVENLLASSTRAYQSKEGRRKPDG